MKTNFKLIVFSFLILGISISLQSLFASWVEPLSNPPFDNIPAPINTGMNSQQKLGGLSVGGDLLSAGTIYASTTIMSLSGDMNIDAGPNGMEFNIDMDGTGEDEFLYKINGSPVVMIDSNGDFYAGDVFSHGDELVSEFDLVNNFYNKVEVDNAIAAGGGGGATSFDLFNGEHSSSQCSDNGGVVVDMGIGKFCRFDGTMELNQWNQLGFISPECPALWAQYADMTETVGSNTCTGYNNSNCSCPPGSCTVSPGHSFSISVLEQCGYQNGNCGQWGACLSSQCFASIHAIGCY